MDHKKQINKDIRKEAVQMKRTKMILLTGLIVLVVGLTGCYTVVMVPRQAVERVETEDMLVEEEPYEDVAEEMYFDEEGAETVIHKHYYYGDIWPDYVMFDPYWHSPYWWHYSTWVGWNYPYYGWWDPWDYYGYGHNTWYANWYYRPWHHRYQQYYYGGYWAYYDGYYGSGYQRTLEKQPFGERQPFGITRVRSSSGSGLAKGGGERISVSRGHDGTRVSSTRTGTRVSNENGTRSPTVVSRKGSGSGSDAASTKATTRVSKRSGSNRSGTTIRRRSSSSSGSRSSGSSGGVRVKKRRQNQPSREKDAIITGIF